MNGAGAYRSMRFRSTASGLMPAWRRLAAAASLLLVIAVGGCGAPAVIGHPWMGESPPPMATDGISVPPDLAQILQAGTPGQRLRYRLVQGGEAWFVLGPIFYSSRGVPCRIGRVSLPGAGNASPTSYPFCQIGEQWYAMKPVVVSGY
jgi:hypothetical protein